MAFNSVDELNRLCSNTLISHLGITFIELSDTVIKASMPVDQRTIQPLGLLHGGAIMALAETVGSAGSFHLVDRNKFNVVGIEINGNHVATTNCDSVIAIGKILHQGKQTHVWSVEIIDKLGKPISFCRVTNMIIEKI